MKLFDTETAACTYTFHDHDGHVNSVTFNIDGNRSVHQLKRSVFRNKNVVVVYQGIQLFAC